MQAHSRKLIPFWKQDIAAVVLVVIYVALAFLLIMTWNYLSEEANAFVSEAKQINREELADIFRSQAPAAKEVGDADHGQELDPMGSLACGMAMAAPCVGMKTILPQ